MVSSESYSWLRKYTQQHNKPIGKGYFIQKRAFDLFLVIATMPLWLPVVGIIAFAIKLTDPKAPVIFIQQRTGKGGVRFSMYKFRTMVPNAEALKEKYAHLNELAWPDFKITNDPRITRVGRLLRKTSMDELPQLFNILKGDMSLVGPRPTSFSSASYELWHTARLDMLPGMTGLWQITARSSVDLDKRSRLDIIYVERRCFRLDLEILLRTVKVVLLTRGAR